MLLKDSENINSPNVDIPVRTIGPHVVINSVADMDRPCMPTGAGGSTMTYLNFAHPFPWVTTISNPSQANYFGTGRGPASSCHTPHHASSSAGSVVSHDQVLTPNGALGQLPCNTSNSDRKRKAPTLRDADWEPMRDLIVRFYVDENQTIPQVKEILERDAQFVAT